MAQESKLQLQSLLNAHNISAEETNVEEYALKLLSDNTSVRTNHSEVEARLSGLVEKSWILNNGAFGDALQQRIEEIPSISSPWTPDVLSFLLALSDRPIQKTRVEDLESLVANPPTPLLTWDAIIEEDPLEDQTAVWRDIDFAADGSDDDDNVIPHLSGNSDDGESVEVSEPEIIEDDLESLIVAVHTGALEEVSTAQAWRGDVADDKGRDATKEQEALEILEINAVREVIFMLQGLPTSIFESDDRNELKLRQQLKFRHTSSGPVTHLIDSMLALGQKLSTIREWIERDLYVPLEEALQSALESHLQVFCSILHDLQKRSLDHSHCVVVSIVDACTEVFKSSGLLLQLHDLLIRVEEVSESGRPFRILEALYDQTCINQKVGDDEGYECIARIFFRCFQVYLKPIKAWMETGSADSHNPIMFIKKAVDDVAPPLLWQDQYRLIQNANGALKAPQFLNVAGRKIFTAGKSVYFLKKLGFQNPTLTIRPHGEPLMTYEAVCSIVDPRKLIPFSELFDMALAGWIASKQLSSSVLLRQQLESQCGLERAFMAVHHIYLYRNGALSNNAMRPLFEKIERGDRHWNDPFSTTELFQDAFAAIDCIDVDRLSVRPSTSKHASNNRGKSMNVLEKLHLSYMLPWPIANIITSQSLATYQRIFIFLTQLERARFLLQRNKLPINAPKLVYAVHTNLLWFVNTMLSHFTTLVISINTKVLQQDMIDAEDVDAMIAVHKTYISKLEDQCFLAEKNVSLRRAVVSVLDLTVLFSSSEVPLDSQQQKGRSDASSGEEDEEDDSGLPQPAKSVNGVALQSMERLGSIHSTYHQLLSIVAASVESIRKSDGGLSWTVLASHLALGA